MGTSIGESLIADLSAVMLLLWSKGPTQSSRERSGRWELSEEQPEDLDGRGGGLADRARRLLVPVGDALG
ncbi:MULTISPECIES: hypothetical protein [unclassified Pseudonocardia]|uniref:hypothetical protein n=1 Tax=unclassified Pseudonocardia TaxID=2619320 RepID=UPI001AC5EC5D|nr:MULTISPECIES: hypothetical protein [unclassified Pseudonocardia]MBN9100986.1 hypothetical protein [Pseudonocardia sp.]